jgi:hypothetical protein
MKNINDKQTFEELTIVDGHFKQIWYIVQGWRIPLQASKEYWIANYGIDPTKAVVKRTTLKEDRTLPAAENNSEEEE